MRVEESTERLILSKQKPNIIINDNNETEQVTEIKHAFRYVSSKQLKLYLLQYGF